LPRDLLPEDWQGDAARALAGRIYERLIARSERFLDRCGQTEKGPLPPPAAAFYSRFSG